MKQNKGITLVALVITIIVLLILAGIVISLALGEHGLVQMAEKSKEEYTKEEARGKLELVLLHMQAEKETNDAYNSNEYLTSKIEENDMKVDGDFVSVDGWEFQIDRNVPEIISTGNRPDTMKANESIIGKIAGITKSGDYEIKVNRKLEDGATKEETYDTDVIYYHGDLILDGTKEIEGATLVGNVYEFGNKEIDVATATENAKKTVVLKVNGNLTINEGVTLTSCKSDSGYGGPKGMFIYCTGTITNNGIISMTARGAKAVGEDVYLWQNEDNKTYEYVPAIGGAGGKGTEIKNTKGSWSASNGNSGINGINRMTGGGGGGASRAWASWAVSGTGSTGTSYSGGSGGGSIVMRRRLDWQ